MSLMYCVFVSLMFFCHFYWRQLRVLCHLIVNLYCKFYRTMGYDLSAISYLLFFRAIVCMHRAIARNGSGFNRVWFVVGIWFRTSKCPRLQRAVFAARAENDNYCSRSLEHVTTLDHRNRSNALRSLIESRNGLSCDRGRTSCVRG